MGTQASISCVNPDGTITSIFCYNDGYVNGVGKTLVNYYKEYDKINELMKLGDIESLGDEVSECEVDEYYVEPATVFDDVTDWKDGLEFQRYDYVFKDGKWHLYKDGCYCEIKC